MQIFYKSTFQKDFVKLPEKIQAIFYQRLEFLKENIFHPYLHAKRLSGKWQGFYSFRLTRNYRCIFSKEQNLITLYFISHRKNIYS